MTDRGNQCLLFHTEYKDVLTAPLKSSHRIKYTCFDISENFIIFGATSGGLYIFSRDTHEHLQLIPTAEGAAGKISISDNENFIAVSTKRNIICIIGINENAFGKLVTKFEDLCNSTITALQWSVDGNTLFIGDSDGRLSMLKMPFLNKNIFNLPTYVLINFDSKIVQISRHSELLLISTLTTCYLCDTVKEHYKQIGTKLRDGLYGACFLNVTDILVKLFSARPGSRLWEIDVEGNVCSTQEFKRALAIRPSTFVSIAKVPKLIVSEKQEWPEQSLNFEKLQGVCNKYIFTYKDNGVYIFNVEKASVLFWTNYFTELEDCKCFDNVIYVWTKLGYLHELVMLPLDKCLLKLYFLKYYDLCVEVVMLYNDIIIGSSDMLKDLHPLINLHEYVECKDDEILYTLTVFAEKLKNVKENLMSIETESGMHIINNNHLFKQLVEGKAAQENKSEIDKEHRRSDSFSSVVVYNGLNNVLDNSKSVLKPDTPEEYYASQNAKKLSNFPIDKYFIDIGYHTPFLTLASYEILQDSFTELGTNFAEIFSASSKNLKDKLENMEIRLNPFKNKSPTNQFLKPTLLVDEDTIEDKTEDCPIIEVEIKHAKLPEIDTLKVIEICDKLNNCKETLDVYNELIQEIISQYYVFISQSDTKDYFPFSTYFPSSIVDIIKSAINDSSVLHNYVKIDNLVRFDENFNKYYPVLLEKVYDCDILKIDFVSRQVLLIFSELLDSTALIRYLHSLNIPCYYLSFTFILNYFQDGNHVDSKVNEWPLPMFLNAMLLMLGLDQIEPFCQMGIKRNINLCHISYLVLTLDNNSNNQNIFLTYLNKHLLLNPSDIYTVFKNRSVLCHMAYEFSKLTFTSVDLCYCSFPFREGTNHPIPFEKIGNTLVLFFWYICHNIYMTRTIDKMPDLTYLNDLGNLIFPDDYRTGNEFCYANLKTCDHKICSTAFANYDRSITNNSCILIAAFKILCLICCKCPNLWNYIISLQKKTNFKILSFEHYIQLGIMSELKPLLTNLVLIKQILDLNLKIQDGYCLNCNKYSGKTRMALPWTDLLIMVLQNLDVYSTLSLVRELPIPQSFCDKRFYQSCIVPLIVSNEGKSIQKLVINMISNLHNICPVPREINASIIKAVCQDTKKTNFFNSAEINLFFPLARHHWGMSIHLNKVVCLCCSLPLFSRTLLQEENGGITVFSCRHSYHTICLKHKNSITSCIFCYTKLLKE